MSLCTVDEVKSWLDIDGSAANEELLEDLATWMSKVFETFCDRVFDSDTYTEYHDGNPKKKKLLLKQYPITEVTSIYDDIDWTWGIDTLISADDYRITEDSRHIVFKNISLLDYRQNVKITYVAGHDPIPSDLNLACIDEVARIYKGRSDRHLLNYSNTSGENRSFSMADFTDLTKTVLHRYRKK